MVILLYVLLAVNNIGDGADGVVVWVELPVCDEPVGLLTPQLYRNNDKLNRIIKLIDATRSDLRYFVMGAFRFELFFRVSPPHYTRIVKSCISPKMVIFKLRQITK
jgi:hypothetical protein